MAIKNRRENPVIILDCAIVAVDRKLYNVRDSKGGLTGEVQDRGRSLTVQTGSMNSDQLELVVSSEFDSIDFEQGTRVLVNVEYMEWAFTPSGAAELKGSTMRFHSFVSASQFDAWKGVVGTQTRGKVDAS